MNYNTDFFYLYYKLLYTKYGKHWIGESKMLGEIIVFSIN